MVTKPLKWSGVAAIITGLLTIIFWFIHPDPSLTDIAARTTEQWRFAYTLFITLIILNLFALIGMYVRQMNERRVLNFLGFFLSFIGTAIFVGAGVIDGYVSSVLALDPITIPLIGMEGPLFEAVGPLFLVGGISFALGFILFGLAILLGSRLPRWSGLLLIVSAPILGMSPMMPELARTIGSVIYGIAFVWIGVSLWRIHKSQ